MAERLAKIIGIFQIRASDNYDSPISQGHYSSQAFNLNNMSMNSDRKVSQSLASSFMESNTSRISQLPNNFQASQSYSKEKASDVALKNTGNLTREGSEHYLPFQLSNTGEKDPLYRKIMEEKASEKIVYESSYPKGSTSASNQMSYLGSGMLINSRVST